MITLPHQLGPYRLERLLGQGGMGEVYVAYDQRLERRVAVKRMLTGRESPRRRARLRREARTTAQLAHPAIVQVFDFIEDEDGDWIVMELVDGKPLARLLVDGPLAIDLALKYGLQIAEGLGAAHQLGIVHRDLKTENVIVLPDDRVKILDFGLAKQLDRLTDQEKVNPLDQITLSETGMVMGTGRSMSPEQARGLEVGPRSDLFSFGVLLYEVLTGVSPFRAGNLIDTLQQVISHQPQPMVKIATDIPPALSELVERLLYKSAELRPASAREVAAEINHLSEQRRFQGSGTPWSANPADDPTPTVTATALLDADPTSGSETHEIPADRWLAGRLFFQRLPGKVVAGAASAVMIAAAVLAILGWPDRDPHDPAAVGIHPATEPLPDNPLQLYEEAMQAIRRIENPQNVDFAINIFQRLITRDSKSAAAHAGLARAYWEKARSAAAGGDPIFLEQAMAIAEEAVRLDAYLADARVSLGLVLLKQGHYDEAHSQLETARELDPKNADAHYSLAKLAEYQGRPGDAENHHRQAIKRRPTTLYYNAFGSFLYDSGRYKEAEEAFLASLTLAPDNAHALRNLGSLYYARGDFDEAAAMFQSALKVHPSASLYSNLGTIFFSRGLYTQATAAFEDALGMEGATNNFIYWINLSDAYRQIPGKGEAAQTSYHRAILLLDDAIKMAPDDVRLLSRRGLAQARSGDIQGALDDVARVRELGTDGDLYSLFRTAVTEELCGQREKALDSLEKALRSGFSLSEAQHEPDLLKLRADLRFHHLLVALDKAL